MLNTYTNGAPQQNKSLDDSKNITTILPPEITSTPFSTSAKPRTSSSLVTPSRRILGHRRYALSSNGNLSPLKTIKDPPGPLLTSTSYNVNVSTYIDTKSPGYTGRVVQYSEEASRNKQQHTHQEKYGSPGLFPIVHLFKKDLPVISPKLKTSSVRFGTPELKSPYSQEHNRLLLEDIVRSSPASKNNTQSNEVSTRSVLDALKEISRKRIHASEEYDSSDETNKKLRRDCVNGDGDSSKRNRVDSPQSDSSVSPPSRQAMKKLCTIDAVLASKTSSMYSDYETGTKRKTVSAEENKTKISPVNKKKFTNAETQTILSPVEKKTAIVEYHSGESVAKKQEQNVEQSKHSEKIISPPPRQVLKVFDDKPLEIIRKNRLGALLSALTGQEIPPIPMEDRRKALDQDWPPQTTEKKIVSILSSQNKQAKSTEKHVTFDLPDSQSNISVPASDNVKSDDKSTKESVETDNVVTSKATENNLISTDLNKDATKSDISTEPQILGNNGNDKALSDKPPPSSTKKDDTQTIPETSKRLPIGGFKFDLAKPISNTSKVTSDNKTTGDPVKSDNTAPSFTQSRIEVPISTSNSSTPSLTVTPNQLSKFQMTQKSEASPNPSATTLTFKGTNVVNPLGISTSLNSVSTTSAGIPSASITFGTPQPHMSSSEKASPVFPIGKTIAPSFRSLSSNKNSAISNVSSQNSVTTQVGDCLVSSAPTFTFGSSALSSNPNNPSSPAFSSSIAGSGVQTSNSSNPAANSSASTFSSPSFVLPSNTSTFNVPVSKNLFTISASTPFGATTNISTSASNSVTSSSGTNTFSFNSGKPLPAFSTSNFPTTSSVSSISNFGNTLNTSVSNSNSAFSNKPMTFLNPPASSAPNTSSMFGTTPTLTFGNNANNTLGTSSKGFAFGSNSGPISSSANTSSMFSQSGMTLGTNTTASSASNLLFGITIPTYGAATSGSKFASDSGFGQSSTVSAFGSTPPFGVVTTTPTFGSTNTLTFGAPGTNAPSFGVPTTSTPGFGTPSTSAPSFGTPSTSAPSFGTPTTSAPSYGNAITSFGTANTTIFNSTNTPFGTTNTTSSGFGTTNTFGLISPAGPSFGTNTSSFGVPTTSSVFGSTNTPTFGNPTTTATFGATNTSTFGNNAFSGPSFGTNPPPFGVATTTSNNTFNSNNTASPFGISSTTNGFGNFASTNSPFSPTTTTPTFGTPTNNAFGSSSTTSTFGNSNVANTSFGNTNGFGSAPNANPFGSNTGKPNLNFGGFSATSSKPEQASSVFSPQANNIFNSNPTFNSNQPNNLNNGSASTSGIFTFGSPNTQSSSSNGVFAFGASEAPKTFNFSAPGTSGTAPTSSGPGFSSFGQPNTMFNIGSGASSTQNRSSRPVARAKRRT